MEQSFLQNLPSGLAVSPYFMVYYYEFVKKRYHFTGCGGHDGTGGRLQQHMGRRRPRGGERRLPGFPPPVTDDATKQTESTEQNQKNKPFVHGDSVWAK